MSLKSIITSALVLGTSSAALASPAINSWRTPTPIVRDHRDAPVITAGANVSFGFGFGTPAPTRPVRIVNHRYDRTPRGDYFNGGYSSNAPYTAPVEPSYYGNGYDSGYENRYQPQWMTLGTVDYPIQTGVVPFDVRGCEHPISKLMLQTNGGKTYVMDVSIRFANGRTQVVNVDRYVGLQGSLAAPASPTLTINVDPRAGRVVSVSADVSNANNSSFSVLAI